jgi:hypothetical protein
MSPCHSHSHRIGCHVSDVNDMYIGSYDIDMVWYGMTWHDMTAHWTHIPVLPFAPVFPVLPVLPLAPVALVAISVSV